MTRDEAALIPALLIHPSADIEDAFFYKLSLCGKLSREEGEKALARLKQRDREEIGQKAFLEAHFCVADLMMHNLETYGVPCIDWIKE